MSFRKDVRGLDPSSPEYKEIVEKYRNAEEARNKHESQRNEMIYAILAECYPAKTLNVSKLKFLKAERIARVLAAARTFNAELKAAGIVVETFVIRGQ